MMRWDVINSFIEKNGYKSYLELGYYKGWSFDQINCEYKCAVDPSPCKDAEQLALGQRDYIIYKEKDLAIKEIVNKNTSDDFFSRLLEDAKFDIVFIDGLHEATQVEKDIRNALRYLSPKGTIVLHDCNPPKYEHTTTGIDGCWTGDVYKTIIKYASDPLYNFYTVDTDWGIGVLTPVRGMHVNGRTSVQKYIDNWELFDQNRKWLLNLISVEEFKTKMNEGTTDNNSTT